MLCWLTCFKTDYIWGVLFWGKMDVIDLVLARLYLNDHAYLFVLISQFVFICLDLYVFSNFKTCCIYLSWNKLGGVFCHDVRQVVFNCLDLCEDIRRMCALVVHVSHILCIQGHICNECQKYFSLGEVS